MKISACRDTVADMQIEHRATLYGAAQLQRFFYMLLMVLAVLVCADHTRRWFHELPTDLRAFYAAGQVVNLHADPFTVQPLLGLERNLTAGAAGQTIVAPVPLPPYDLAALGLLARLPVQFAAGVMAFLTLGAGLVTAAALYRAARIPLTLAIAVSYLATIYSASGLGQVAPLAIAAIAFTTWAVREKRYNWAGLALAMSLIQPQIAVAPLLSLLCFVPKARLWAVVCIVGEILASIICIGPTLMRQYLTVLGMHARAEMHFPAQLSLTWLLSIFGAPPAIAILLGSVSTLFMIAAAIAIVARHRGPAVLNGAVIALPAVFGVIGGSFLHEHQLALAIVPALLALRPTTALFDSSWAVGALTIPFLSFLTLEPYWPKASAYPSILLAFLVCWAIVYGRSELLGTTLAVRKATIVTAGLGVVFVVFMKLRPFIAFDIPTVVPVPNENASIEWAYFCEAANAAYHTAVFPLLVKLPVWASAVAIAVCSARNIEKAA